MKHIISVIICGILLILVLPNISYSKDEDRHEFKKYFDEYSVVGTFVLYDSKNNKFIRYNPERATKGFIPASTFKIANSLIGLETGEIPDENYVFKWNGEKRSFDFWEKDLVLRDAFQVSCVPCYQELARQIGEKRMKKWVKKLKYGNRDISGGIDKFWLTGDLRISANEQIKFLRRLYENDLPLKDRSMNIVKKIMLRKETQEYKIYGKTGWQVDDLKNAESSHSIGWFIGFLERGENVFFFATNVETDNTQKNFAASRVAITENILKELNLL
jgi:beta-lactamase class D